MPDFCRHNRFAHNCPICKQPPSPPKSAASRSAGATRSRPAGSPSRRAGGMRVRHTTQAASDGFEHELVPGIKATADARRLAEELAFAVARLGELASDPPGLYAEIGAEPDPEEARWLAFLVAYIGPAAGDEDPFAAIRAARVPWATGELPGLDGVALGPRTAHDPARGTRTIEAYRTWVGRAGTQQAALEGEASWTPERRFDRLFERLALPGFGRGSRYELLVTLARLGVIDARPNGLQLGGADDVTIAAKRVFGIGDTILLERRSRDLADELGVPIEAVDLALLNWGRHPRPRATQGASSTELADEAELLAGVLGA